MRKMLALSAFALILVGCASPKYNYTPKVTEISDPPVGSVNTSYIGDAMLRQGSYTEYDGIVVTQPAKVAIAYTVLPGQYKKTGEDNKREYYIPSGGEKSGGIDKAWVADPWKSIMAEKSTNKLCVITVFNAYTCSDNMPFERKKINMASADSFQQTIMYSGKIGNKINLSYREFSNSIARPAFNNDVEYDLSESKVLGYKGARIEVIEATNQYIRYKVVSNFNK